MHKGVVGEDAITMRRIDSQTPLFSPNASELPCDLVTMRLSLEELQATAAFQSPTLPTSTVLC